MLSVALAREEFENRHRCRFKDPAFEPLQRELDADGLTDMSLISAGGMSEAGGYIGCMEPYATSHQVLDDDETFQENVRNVARALGKAVTLHRAGKHEEPGKGLIDPSPK